VRVLDLLGVQLRLAPLVGTARLDGRDALSLTLVNQCPLELHNGTQQAEYGVACGVFASGAVGLYPSVRNVRVTPLVVISSTMSTKSRSECARRPIEVTTSSSPSCIAMGYTVDTGHGSAGGAGVAAVAAARAQPSRRARCSDGRPLGVVGGRCRGTGRGARWRSARRVRTHTGTCCGSQESPRSPYASRASTRAHAPRLPLPRSFIGASCWQVSSSEQKVAGSNPVRGTARPPARTRGGGLVNPTGVAPRLG